MYNRQEYSHNFACAFHHGENSSAKRLCYTHIFCSHCDVFNDLHICSKRHYHDINFPGRAVVAFLLNEDFRGATGRLPSKKDKYPHSGIITGDAHSSYKVNPNCALCQKTSFFFLSQFHVKSRDSSSNIFFSYQFIHFLIFSPLQLLLETRTMTQ